MTAAYGFFPAAGTNYSAGDEPEIAKRLDALAKALHLRLIGISGFRTPQHSVAVGGFANDPHTQGKASDTAGVESIPETTLERFGLTRPFGGAREANHVQLKPGLYIKGQPYTGDGSGSSSLHGGADAQTGGVAAVAPQIDAETKLAAGLATGVVNVVWNAIGQDATRILLYVLLVGGGLALSYAGVKRVASPA